MENGPSGCESTSYCMRDRLHFGATAEQHFNAEGTFDPWVGVDIEAVRAFGTSTLTHESEARWGALVAVKAGFDVLSHTRGGLAGIGLFAAVPMGGVKDANGIGLTLGIRVPFGMF